MRAEQREYLYEFINKYEIDSDGVDYFTKIKIEHWQEFLSLIDENHITKQDKLVVIARRNPDQRQVFAKLIANKNIDNFFVLDELSYIADKHFDFLCAFVEEFGINDQFIIYGLAMIPSIKQWTHIYELVQPLIRIDTPTNRDTGLVMRALYKITEQEYRIDRVMPTYNENERLARLARAQNKINNNLIRPGYGYYQDIVEILETPIPQEIDMHQALVTGRKYINVHAEGRDGGTGDALKQLVSIPYDTNRVDADYAEFIEYLNAFPNAFPNAFIKLNAEYVLGLNTTHVEGFAPLDANMEISSFNLNITGKEFLARCWSYIQRGEFIGNHSVESLTKDRENARISLVKKIAECYEDDSVICNPGKLQHIAVGVLQGRLKDAHIDREIPINSEPAAQDLPEVKPVNINSLLRNTVAASLRYFLMQYENKVGSQQELKSHVDDWLIAPRGLDGDSYKQYCIDFRKDLDEYLRLSSLPEVNDMSQTPTMQSANMTLFSHSNKDESMNVDENTKTNGL